MALIKELKKDQLKVCIYDSEAAMGQASAAYAAALLKELAACQEEVNIFLSTARSQEEMFHALEADRDIPWEKVNLFHVDEYIGLAKDQDELLSNQLLGYFFKTVQFKNTFFMNSLAPDIDAECVRYEALIRQHPIDISFLGIGDNGHLAFNEPHLANFNDPVFVKIADVDDTSKNQLVKHKNFATPQDVPSTAFTVTLPALMSAKHVICTTPFATKAQACADTLMTEVGEACPATIMRTHKSAVAFFDAGSASIYLKQNP